MGTLSDSGATRCSSWLCRVKLLSLVVVLLAGCAERELVSDLSQREKVVVLSALIDAGIGAREESGGSRKRYALFVPESSHGAALQILSRLGLPRKQSSNTREFLSESNTIPPTPEVVALRLELVAGERLRELLMALPGVIDVEVLYRKGSQASILIRHTSEDPELSRQVKDLSHKSFPELTGEQIDLKLFSIKQSEDAVVSFGRPFSFRVLKSERGMASAEVFGWLGAAILMALFVGFYGGLHVSTLYWRRVERRRAERRRTGDYAVVAMQTSSAIPVVKSDDTGAKKEGGAQ